MHLISAFLIGVLFATGLAISNMINPNKVLNFLDFFGHWDPTLLIVMITAVVTTFIGYRFVFQMKKPRLAEQFYLPPQRKIKTSFLVGSTIFGIGWGITGYCPGPSITALATFNLEPFYFVMGMILGSYTYWLIFKYLEKRINNE